MKDSPELDFHLRCRALCEWCGWTLDETRHETFTSPESPNPGMFIKDNNITFFGLDHIELLEALMHRERAKELGPTTKFPGIARLNMDAIKPAIGVPTCQPETYRDRAVACVNACAGLDDPEADIRRLCELISTLPMREAIPNHVDLARRWLAAHGEGKP